MAMGDKIFSGPQVQPCNCLSFESGCSRAFQDYQQYFRLPLSWLVGFCKSLTLLMCLKKHDDGNLPQSKEYSLFETRCPSAAKYQTHHNHCIGHSQFC